MIIKSAIYFSRYDVWYGMLSIYIIIFSIKKSGTYISIFMVLYCTYHKYNEEIGKKILYTTSSTCKLEGDGRRNFIKNGV